MGGKFRGSSCTLALSSIRDTLIEGFSHFVTSMTAPVASGWSVCRVGLAPTGKRRLCTAHTPTRHSSIQGFWRVAGLPMICIKSKARAPSNVARSDRLVMTNETTIVLVKLLHTAIYLFVSLCICMYLFAPSRGGLRLS
jgi:hypothetical protein